MQSPKQVKRDNMWLCGRSVGRRHGGRGKQSQQTGQPSTPQTNANTRILSVLTAILTGHLQSECRNAKPPPKKMASKQHVHHTEQDSETRLQDNTADEYLGSIFATEESQK